MGTRKPIKCGSRRAMKLNLFVKGEVTWWPQLTLKGLTTNTDLLSNVVVKTQARDDAQCKYFQLLTPMCQKRQQLLVELFHVLLLTKTPSFNVTHFIARGLRPAWMTVLTEDFFSAMTELRLSFQVQFSQLSFTSQSTQIGHFGHALPSQSLG